MSTPQAAAPRKPGIIQWNHVIPALISVLVIILLVILFLDPVAKWAMIKAGEGVFGARVEIEAVRIKLTQSRLSIRDLQVADKSAPMQNLFQFDEATFDFRSLPLLEKKVIVDDASLKGLKFGTPRKHSGALLLSEKQPGIVGKAVDRLWGQVETVSLAKFEGAKQYYDPKTVVNPDHLQTYKAADQAKQAIQAAPADIQKQIDQLNAPARTADFQKRAQALGQGKSDPTAILQKVTEAKKLQTDLGAFKSDVENTQKQVLDKIQSAQNQIESVKKAREEDWKRLRSTLSLPSLDKEAMARALFGPTIARWMERILGWVQESRQYMPAKPQSPPPPPRGRGRTIEFPKENELPRFLLAHAQVSGEVGREQPFGFMGTLTGITSNPPLYGKPATLQVQGSQGARSFQARGVLDHTKPVPLESFQAVYNGFSLASLSFGQPDSLAFGVKQGQGRARAAITLQGDALGGQADIEGSDLALDPKIDLKSNSVIAQRATQNISASLGAVKALKAGIRVSGTMSSPEFAVDSNIGSVVADALKNALGAEVAQQEQALRAELDRQTQAKIQELQSQVDALRQKYLPPLAANNKVIDDLINQVKNQASRGLSGGGTKPLDTFKGLFGR